MGINGLGTVARAVWATQRVFGERIGSTCQAGLSAGGSEDTMLMWKSGAQRAVLGNLASSL